MGETVAITLEPDLADLMHDSDPETQTLLAEVKSVDKHVPSSVRITVRTGTAPTGRADERTAPHPEGENTDG